MSLHCGTMMPEFLADDAAAIAERMRAIREAEAPIGNADIASATGRDLRLLANAHGVVWSETDTDYNIRLAVKRSLGLAWHDLVTWLADIAERTIELERVQIVIDQALWEFDLPNDD